MALGKERNHFDIISGSFKTSNCQFCHWYEMNGVHQPQNVHPRLEVKPQSVLGRFSYELHSSMMPGCEGRARETCFLSKQPENRISLRRENENSYSAFLDKLCRGIRAHTCQN
jgi:hypothetical protein